MTARQQPTREREPAAPESVPRPRHDARALTDHGRAAQILLDGKVYHLRITRQSKLILTR
jgi:hemin uptake protein HemP